jgi:hypothetical protein
MYVPRYNEVDVYRNSFEFKIGDEVMYIGNNMEITGGTLQKNMVGVIEGIHNISKRNPTYFVTFKAQNSTMTDGVHLIKAVLEPKRK